MIIISLSQSFIITKGLEALIYDHISIKEHDIDDVINNITYEMIEVANKYAVWDETYYAFMNSDTQWLHKNITQNLVTEESCNIDFAYVVDVKKDVIAFAGEFISKESVDSIELKESVADYFVIDNELYLIYSVKVGDTRTINRSAFIAVGKRIDENYLSALLSETFPTEFKGVVQSTEFGDGSKQINKGNGIADTNEFYIDKTFYGFNGELLKNYRVSFQLELYSSKFESMLSVFHYTLMGFAGTLMVIVIIAVNKVDSRFDKLFSQLNRVTGGDYSYKIERSEYFEFQNIVRQINLLSSEVQRKISEIEETKLDTISTLVNAIEAKDKYTKGHSERVKNIALIISKEFEGIDQDMLSTAAILHDIGKISIHEDLLNKLETLSDEEFNIIKTHPSMGYQILSNSKMLNEIKEIVIQHHERPDGKGYPYGLKGDQISIYSKILQVSDALDAITSDRPYRKGRGFDVAIAIILQERGKQFDNGVVTALLKHRFEIKEYLESYERHVRNETLGELGGTVLYTS